MKNLHVKIRIELLLTALFLMSALFANAQKAEFGVRFMPTISSISLKTSSGGAIKGDAVVGLGFGVVMGFNFTNHVGIQTEIIYNEFSQKYAELGVDRTIRLKYVNIPVLLSINSGKKKPVNFNFVVGPQIGISVGSNVTTSGFVLTSTSQAVLKVKKSDIGLAYGAGLDFGLNHAKTVRFGFGFRGVYGLVDISDNSNTVITNSYYILDKSHITTYTAYAGLSFLF